MKKLLITAATIVVFSLGLTACIDKTPDAPSNPKDPIINEADCTKAGGEWKKVGLLGSLACVLTTKDAGKSCTDSEQCEERCLAKVDENDSTKTIGQCQTTNQPFGCHSEMEGGIAGPPLCID